MLLKAESLSRSFGRDEVLRGISLQVASGESLAISGPSGSGKSTLLSVLGLLQDPTSGHVYVDEQNTSELSDDERSHLRNRCFGFVFQNPQLVGSLSVLDNVLVPARLGRLRDMEKTAWRLLDQMGLAHRERHLPHQLSIGQKRRVALARALLLDPPIILADEPTNDLDASRAEQVCQLLFELPKRGRALVVVSHDAALCGHADRVATLNEGTLSTTPSNVFSAAQSGSRPA